MPYPPTRPRPLPFVSVPAFFHRAWTRKKSSCSRRLWNRLVQSGTNPPALGVNPPLCPRIRRMPQRPATDAELDSFCKFLNARAKSREPVVTFTFAYQNCGCADHRARLARRGEHHATNTRPPFFRGGRHRAPHRATLSRRRLAASLVRSRGGQRP